MLRALTATVCSGLLLGGCGASWPNRAAALATPRVHQVTTVDVLPIDLEVWTEHGYPQPPEDIRDSASSRVMMGAVDLLQKNGYAIDGLIDWNGEIDGRGAVIERGDLEHTIASLAAYDVKTGRFPVRLPDPQLPAKLGTVSGADATLYIGGWAYVAAEHESTGEKVAEGILIGVAIVAVVAIVAIALSSKSSSSGGSHGGGGGGGSHVASGGHSAPTFHDHRGGVAAADNPSFVTVASGSVRDHRSGGSWSPSRSPSSVHVASGPAVHIDTAIDVIDSIDPQTVSHPDWSGDVPTSGEDSQMYLEMTLVDNATGTVLWHAHQKFPANASSQEDLSRVTRTLIASLPAR